MADNRLPVPEWAEGLTASESLVIYDALRILENRIRKSGECLGSPVQVRTFLKLQMAGLAREVFSVLWLDSQNGLIAFEELFSGTLTQTSVYPREIVKRALHWNAGSAIFAHNHPSGSAEPSSADEKLTRNLRDALAFVDVRVVDHFVVTNDMQVSLAERGLI
ncbi:JAB domain-containing protein [Accumulibacter sp.]|uniref:JAB domain-containing protein n=1 Tax=Accumulibacter sp. TaxID=2053492 RepID=UPI0034352571